MNSNDPLLYNAIKEKDRSKDAERLILGLRYCGAAVDSRGAAIEDTP